MNTSRKKQSTLDENESVKKENDLDPRIQVKCFVVRIFMKLCTSVSCDGVLYFVLIIVYRRN